MDRFSDGSSILPISTNYEGLADRRGLCTLEVVMRKSKNNTYSIRYNDCYLTKQKCIEKAREIIEGDKIHRMTEAEISSEIYSHAWAHHFASLLEKKGLRSFAWIKRAADPIDLADGGDYFFRKLAYRVFWLIPLKNKVRGHGE